MLMVGVIGTKLKNRMILFGIVLLLLSMSGCGKEDVSAVQAATAIQESQVQAGRDPDSVKQLQSPEPEEKTSDDSESGNEVRQNTESADRRKQAVAAVQIAEESDRVASEESVQKSEQESVQKTEAEVVQEAEMEVSLESETEAEEEERDLTDQELKKLQWSIRSTDNGFFACFYDRPEEIDWEQVFYTGAGMNVVLNEGQLDIIRENLREQIRQEREKEEELWYQYLSSNSLFLEEAEESEEEEEPEEEEIEINLTAGDVTTLTLRSIQNFAKNKTGLDYSEARKPLNWPVLTKNVFYFVHEGSNKVTVKLMSAKVKGNVYTLYYRRDNKRGATEPEYVMTVEIEGNKWKYISNLSLKQTPPITLLDIDYYTSGELARLQGTKEMIVAAEEVKEEQNPSKTAKVSTKAPQSYWAVITAREDNTVIHVEKAYLGDDVSEELAGEGFFIPGETIASVFLQKGEKLGIRVTLEDIPKYRIWAGSGDYYGEYAFGSENRLNRMEEDGTPKSTYVLGRDLNGEGRGTAYTTKEELLQFLKGTWVYYDSAIGDYTAKLCFDGGDGVSIAMPGLTYHLTVSKWNRIYVDEKGAPDVMTFQSGDEYTQELIEQWYPSIKKRLGDYRLRAIQRGGMQILYLTPENSGVGCMNYLLPGADDSMDEFVFYRFLGVSEEEPQELENTKG